MSSCTMRKSIYTFIPCNLKNEFCPSPSTFMNHLRWSSMTLTWLPFPVFHATFLHTSPSTSPKEEGSLQLVHLLISWNHGKKTMTHTQHLFTMVWAGCKEGKCSTQYPDDGLVTIPRPEEQERERSSHELWQQGHLIGSATLSGRLQPACVNSTSREPEGWIAG